MLAAFSVPADQAASRYDFGGRFGFLRRVVVCWFSIGCWFGRLFGGRLFAAGRLCRFTRFCWLSGLGRFRVGWIAFGLRRRFALGRCRRLVVGRLCWLGRIGGLRF